MMTARTTIGKASLDVSQFERVSLFVEVFSQQAPDRFELAVRVTSPLLI